MKIYRSDVSFRETYIEDYKHVLSFIRDWYEAATAQNRWIWSKTLTLVNEIIG